MAKKSKKPLSIGQCVQTFLGEVCRWSKGYRLNSPAFENKLIVDEDGEALASGEMLGVDDLEEIEDPEAEDDDEGESEEQKDVVPE